MIYKATAFIFGLFLMIHTPPRTTVWMIGDSTMSIKDPRTYPETGWGMPFAHFFDSTIVVDNRALNGRSTKSFLAENRWKPIFDQLNPGDYVLIEFGHNDEVQTKASATTEDQFQANLRRYITETRSKKAIPVLFTPVARRNFDSAGKFNPTHEVYSGLVRAVAVEEQVVLIDLDKKSQDLIKSWGPKKSAYLYNHLAPGEHPNYPDGKIDNTHFSELGARIMAELAVKEISELMPDLAAHITKPAAK